MADTPFTPPIRQFHDNIRPAELLLKIYQLLDCRDEIMTEGDFVVALRELVSASANEDLMVVHNEIFLGLIRERANLPRATLKTATLTNLLRQAVVASCTALDAFLPAMLRAHLPLVIGVKGRSFFPDDQSLRDYFDELTFSIEEVLRLMVDENATLYISNKLLGKAKFKYLSDRKGVHVVGALLDIDRPWRSIGAHLGRDHRELVSVLDDTVKRRNDIVHRADRPLSDPDGEQADLTFAQASHGVDTIRHVCEALNELVDARVAELAANTSADSSR